MISSLYSAKITLLPYFGGTYYDQSSTRSLKSYSGYGGIYTSIAGEQDIFEMAYNHAQVTYKSGTPLSDYSQHDLTLKYSKQTKNTLFQVALHTIVNNENATYTDLGSGYIGCMTIARNHTFSEDTLSYGLEGYVSLYLDAHSELSRTQSKMISIGQFSPYLTYKVMLGDDMRNDFTFRANLINAIDYRDSNYLSYELSDTMVINRLYLTLRYVGGEVRSGVSNGGLTVINNKDLYTGTYNVTLGYFETEGLAYDLSYALNTYQEYNPDTLNLLPKGVSSTLLVSMSYKF